MAKKRVHEIAKERGIPSKEVLAILQAAGLDVKAAASSVDEHDIARAFNPSRPGGRRRGSPAATATAPRPTAKAGKGADGKSPDPHRAAPAAAAVAARRHAAAAW